MPRFFEGGKEEVRKTLESIKPDRRIRNLVTNIGRDTAKTVNREQIAQQAQQQYTTGQATRDSAIVKSVRELFKPTRLQQRARGGSNSSSVANAGAFNFSYSGGQYSRAGTQARDTLNSIIPQPGDMKAYAEFAAKRDTTTDPLTAHFYDKYALPHSDIGPDAHDLMIGRGQDWMTDSESLMNWILGDAVGGEGFTSEEQYNEAVARQKQYETYMSRYLRDVKAFNPEDGSVQTEKQFTEDAPLPPWIQPTSANIDTWEYYKTYSHDVVQSTADAYDKAWQDQQARAKTPYKSAFSTSHEESDIDSFLDIAISSRSWKQLKNNTANYFRDYVINPIKAGHILTAGGNALWNMMDTMDIASRGVRAFTAGSTVMGGRNTTFKGQNVYWVKLDGRTDEESQRAQKIFMDNGGYELLLKAHPGEATKADLASSKANMSEEELIAKLNQAFAKEGINWRTIYNDLDENFFKNRGMQDVSQAVENVKKAYSDPSAAFNADTGSMASDIIVESVLDPGLVFGGVAKNISKNTVLSSAELAVRDGLINVLDNADDAKALMKDKRVKRAISAFISSNEGKNIIFKNSQNFGDDVNVLLHTLETDMPHLFGNASTPEGARLYKANKRAFADTVSAHLFSKNQNISTDIIKSTGWARDALETKTFKAAYYMDKAIDGIDSAIIKSSFAAPWGVVKGVKQGKRILLNDTAVGRYYYAKRLRKAAAASAVRDEVTKAVDVTKFPDLMAKYNGGQLDEESVRAGLKSIVHEYDKVSKSLPKVTKDFMDGKMTVEEAYKFVGDQISAITGGKYRDINQLVTQVDSYDVRYAGDLSAAYDRLMRNFTTLENTIYKQSDAAVADFLTELNHAENIDDVRRLFRDNMDNKVIMDLRTQVVDKVPFELSVDEVDNIVADLRSGVFSDTPLDKKTMKKAVSAVSQSSDTIVKRTVKVNEFKSFIKHNYAYLLDPANKDAYVRKLAPLLETTAGSPNELSLDDALKCIESAKRSLLTSEHLKASEITTDTAGMIHSDPRMADLRKLKDTIRGLDVISLKDNEVVTIMHVDRMAMMQKFTQAPAIAKVYGADYDNIIAPAVSILETKSLDNVDLAADTFAKDVMRLQELKYGRDRTEILTKQLKSINTLSDNELHTVLNGLGNNFGRAHGTLTDTLSTPGLLRRNLETTARTQGGTPKVGINGLTDMLKSINTDNPSKFIQPYLKEFEDPKKGVRLRAKYDRIVNASALDPNAYVKKQMLASLLMDPDIITEYNGKLAKGNTPIFFHINSSGLSTEINEITSISCIKWQHIDVSDTDPLTMEKILDVIPDEPILFKRGMSDAQIDGISENVLRKLDMKGLSSSQLHDTVRNLYRAADEEAMKSESDVIEEFCAFLQNETVVKKTGKKLGRSTEVGVPTLVVHDLDGFNLPFLNKRASELYGQMPEDSKTRGYLENFSRRIQDASDNTYSRLASKAGDESFTVDELNQIEEMLQDYVRDINDFAGDNFDPFDFEEYGKVFERVLYESTSPVDDELAAVRKAIVQASSGGAVDMEAYKHAMQDIADFAKYPKQFAFLSNTGGDNEVAIALRAAGKDSVNVESRIYVKDVMSFFDIEDADTGQMKSDISSLQKMHNLSQYVIRNRDHNIASGAEVYLAPYKDQFDDVINTVRNIGKNYSAGSEYSYLANIKTPNTAVESYLLSQKLYDDYIRFWCFGDKAETLTDRLDVLNSYKEKLGDIYAETSNAVDDLYDKAKQLNQEQWSLFKSNYASYKADAKNKFNEAAHELWQKYRADKAETRAAYDELNSELWDNYSKQGDLANSLYSEAKKSTQEMWDEYHIDKEYAQMLKEEAQLNTEHLWDDYRVKKAQLGEYYKQLKAETDRIVSSWDASKKFRKQFPTEADIQNIDTNNFDYFERYADYRKAFNAIDWQSYKRAKDSLVKYREFLMSRHDEFYKDYLDQIDYMRHKYDVEAMTNKSNEAWNKFNEAALTKKLMKSYTKEQSDELRAMYESSIQALYNEAKADADDLYQTYIKSCRTYSEDEYYNTKQVTDMIWQLFSMDKADLWKAFEDNPERIKLVEEFFDELMSYFNDYRPRIFDEFTNTGVRYGAKAEMSELDNSLKHADFSVLDDNFVRPVLGDSKSVQDRYVQLTRILESRRESYLRFEHGLLRTLLPDDDFSLSSMYELNQAISDIKARKSPEEVQQYVRELSHYANDLVADDFKRAALVRVATDQFPEYADLFPKIKNLDTIPHLSDYTELANAAYGFSKDGIGFQQFDSGAYEDIFSLFEGEKRPEIFKSAAKSDYFKTVYSYKDGVMKEGIDMATKLSEANANLGSSIRQLDWIDRYYINSGINSRTDRLTGMLHMKAKVLYDMLDATDISRRESFQTFIREASNGYHLKLRQQALDSLRGVDGKFNRDLLLSELVYNDFNHLVFNSHAYTTAEMREFVSSVEEFQKAGADFLSYYEDRTTGNIFVYLNYNADITTDGTKRFLNGKPFERTVKHAVDFVDFDELKNVLDLDDIDEFRDIYEHLKSCWEDTRILSQGRINGTSGKTVSRRQAEEYLETLPSEMYDMLSPKGVLSSDMARGVIYDPGFVRNEDTDILLDFLDTLSRQADVAKEDAVLINEVFNSDSILQFNELSKHFSDKELMDYFGNNPDYVVVTLTSNPNTRTGLQVERLKVDNLASLQVAKEAPNTTILPYDMYYEIADTMNRSTQDGYYRRLLSKYMLVYKAFALVKPGTWIRNYIDATTKAALDNGEDITNVFSLLPYQAKAARDIGTYSRILKADPALLTKSNWEMIQRAFKTDMTFEDFELLRGVMDADQFKSADRYFMNKMTIERGGIRSLNAEDAGLRGLSEKDINIAFKKYLSSETDLPLSQTDFLDIYLGRRTADTATMEQFEDMMRRLSVNMRNSEASGIFDKTINFMFKPFGAVESLARYSQTMYLKDMGLSQNQITKHIHMTQFYTAPSWGMFNKLETIMPFITFRYNNFMYWMRMMDENPRFFRYFEDVYGTIAEDSIENMIESGQSTDYEDDMFFQNGAIPLGDTGLNIKVGNSFLSAVNDFYGGPDSLIGKYGGLNPVLKEALRFSGYAFGLNSKEFFSDVDWDLSKDMTTETAIGLLPGGSIMNQAISLARRLPDTFENGGPSMDTLFQVLSFAGVLGIRKNYSSGGKVDFDEWQLELEKQGKWYDANLGKIVPLADKNTYGANDPNATWEDVQAYMMVHFGKIWDPNAHKFVIPSELSSGNFDVNFDFENDPDAWEKLQKWMKNRYGKVYDYNQRKFVYEEDYISGGLNDPDMPWEQKSRLIYEKFGLRWDGNQNTYVDDNHYIVGGLNDTKNFNEVKSLRLALYGEVWDKAQHKFVKTQDSSVVTIGNFFGGEEYDEYFSRLAIPRLQNINMNFHINNEGLLVTDDGKYILTKNAAYNARIFEKFKHTFGGRRYGGWKRYSFKKTRNKGQFYKGRTLPSHYYTGFGWNDEEGYYRLNYQYNFQYHNPDPAKKLNRLLSPRVQYPYGGGYNKYSFYTR